MPFRPSKHSFAAISKYDSVLREIFHMYDVDDDNVLSKEELRNMIGGVGKRMSAQELDRFIADTMKSQAFIANQVRKSSPSANISTTMAFTRIVSKFVGPMQSIPGSRVSPAKSGQKLNKSLSVTTSIQKKKFSGFDFQEFRIFVDRLSRVLDSKKKETATTTTTTQDSIQEGKDVDLLEEERKIDKIEVENKKEESTVIIHQDSRFKQVWDVFVCLFLIFVMIETPLRIGFDSSPDDASLVMEYFIDTFFIADMAMQFCVSYTDSMGQEENRLRYVALHYIRTTLFIDLVSSVPFNWFLSTSDAVGSAFRFLKLLKLGRLARLNRIIARLRETSDMKNEEEQMIFVLCILFFLSHSMACVWAFAGRYGSCDECLMMESWQSRVDPPIVIIGDNQERWREYLYALYWSVTSLTTVGYGDITPNTTLELVIAVLAMIVGISFYGYLTAVLTAWFLSIDPNVAHMKAEMDALKSYLKKHSYPKTLSRKIKAFFHHYFLHTSTFDDVKMLHRLPYTLHKEAEAFLINSMQSKFMIFRGLSPMYVSVLLKAMKPMELKANSDIVRLGEPATSFYLIKSGIVNIVNSIGDVVAQFREGQSFMEYSAFKLIPCHIFGAIVASRTAEIYAINGDDMLAQLTDKMISNEVSEDTVAIGTMKLRSNIVLLEKLRTVTGQSLMDFDIDSDAFKENTISSSKEDRDHSYELKDRFLAKVRVLRNALRINKFGLIHSEEEGKPKLLQKLCESPKVVKRKSTFPTGNRRSSNGTIYEMRDNIKFKELSQRLDQITASQNKMLEVVKNLIINNNDGGNK